MNMGGKQQMIIFHNIITTVFIFFTIFLVRVGVANASNSVELNNKTYFNMDVLHRSVEPKTGSDFHSLGYKFDLVNSIEFVKDHSVVVGLSQYYAGTDKISDFDQRYKRNETALSFQYKGGYELVSDFKILFGFLTVLKLKVTKGNNDSVLYGGILNASDEQAVPLEARPYLGMSINPWSGGMVLTKVVWRHYFYQDAVIVTDYSNFVVSENTKLDVKVEGGQSLMGIFKYKQELFNAFRLSVWTQYDRIIIPRLARRSTTLGKFQQSSFEDIKGHTLKVGGKASYDLSDRTSIKVWGTYDIIGSLDYIQKGAFNTQEEADSDGGEKLDVEDKTLSGGIGLVYKF